MRHALLLVCIILNQVCTNTLAVGLPVGWTAPEPEGKCIHNISTSLPVGTAIRWSGPPRMPAEPLKGNICLCTHAGCVTIRTLRPLTGRAGDLLHQLRMPPADPANYTQETIDRLASRRPGQLLLASIGDTKKQNRQHPAITGFSISNPPMTVHAVRLLEVAELAGTPTAAIAQGLAKAVQDATGVTGQVTARKLERTVRTVWVDQQDPSKRVLTATWEVQGLVGQDFALKALEPQAAIEVSRWEEGAERFTQGPAVVRPAPPQDGQMEVGRGIEYEVACTAEGHAVDADLVQEVLCQAARQLFAAELQVSKVDSFPHRPDGVAAAMTVLGMAELQLLGAEACYTYTRQGHRTIKVVHGHTLAAAFIAEAGGIDITVQDVGMALIPVQPGQGTGLPMQLTAGVEISGLTTGSIAGDPDQQVAILELLEGRVARYMQQAQQDPAAMGFPAGSTIPRLGKVYLRDMRGGGPLTWRTSGCRRL